MNTCCIKKNNNERRGCQATISEAKRKKNISSISVLSFWTCLESILSLAHRSSSQKSRIAILLLGDDKRAA